jgi:tRNA (cytidine/uridine-2'-O-)-methyltransferase
VNIVLYEPDIPGNTGNVGRSALATGSTLHLVGRLGFSLDHTYLKRSGLDYWEHVEVKRHASWEAFLEATPNDAPLFFFSKKASQSFWEAAFVPESYLIFGCETAGLPPAILERYKERVFRIPMQTGYVRSLNLSTSVGVVLYEALRQTGGVFDGHCAAKTS